MKKTKKIDFAKATANMAERLEYVFHATLTDTWHRGKAGSIVTFSLPQFTNMMDVCSEVGLSIAVAKALGYINDGSVNYDNNDIVTVKFF